jgi:cytidine deaminase
MASEISPEPIAPDQLSELSRLAEAVAHHAYAPYSCFFVGAAILLSSEQHGSQIVTGCNVENSSFRLTTCAEQNAIAAAIARFGPKIRIHAVAVHNLNQSACQPCGACRQTIAEFASPSAVILYPTAGGTATCTLDDLLPQSFQFREPTQP